MLTYTSNTSRITVYFTYPMHLYLKENLKTNEVLIAYNGMDVTEHLSSIVPEVSDQHDAQSFVNYLYRFGVLRPSDTADDLFLPTYSVKISVEYNHIDLVYSTPVDILEKELRIVSDVLSSVDSTIADEFITKVTSTNPSNVDTSVFFPENMSDCSLEILDVNLKRCAALFEPITETELFRVHVGYTLSGEAKRRLEHFVGGVLMDN